LTKYFSDEQAKITVSDEGLQVEGAMYPLSDINYVRPSRKFNWEGMAVYFGIALAIYIFADAIIWKLIGFGFFAFGIYDIWLPRYKLQIVTFTNGTHWTRRYGGKEARVFVNAIINAIMQAKSEHEKAEAGSALR
jgi:hypothetical protein